MSELPDLPARLRALTALDATLLVEAAAGTGKTALIAGRVTVSLARGIPPEHIAAITFNEHAASELSARIHDFITEILRGGMPACLNSVFPEGMSATERACLAAGHARIDELTVTTIHGFCQRLIHSYAVEADIDPGARMMDAPATEAAFRMIFQHWLRERLSRLRVADDPIAVISEDDPLKVEKRLFELANFRRRRRSARPVSANLTHRLETEFATAVSRFHEWLVEQPTEPDTRKLADELVQLAKFYAGCLAEPPNFARLWRLAEPPPLACHDEDTLRLKSPRWRGVWQKAAGKEAGARLADEANALFGSVDASYRNLLGEIATALVQVLSGEIDEMLARYDAFKRQAAVLDFDDLLHRARELVNSHETVRCALGERYRHILIDEFQDTDPIQAETVFRIAAIQHEARWQDSPLRPGALFMVGDPKQAIYRFRGADIGCYGQAKAAIRRQWPQNILHVTASFRSVPGIIDYVNSHFDTVLDAEGQPGYVALHATRAPAEHGLPCVATFGLDPDRPKGVAALRDAEAREVAAVCERLIGNVTYCDARGELVTLRAADIALLAPGSTELWRYERALDQRGLPFASSAGKTLLYRQEVQDLLALARVLADGADTLAFGAVMRGPLVGLTEEDLLDITASLTVREDDPDGMPRFTIRTDPSEVIHPVAHDALTTMRELQRRVHSTTPAVLLGDAVERLKLRPILSAREGNERARAAANVERFLELAREYDVLGLKRFVNDVANEWESGVRRRTEGRVDAEGAIEIVTMHSSKGLEWPVVILINSGSHFFPPSEFVHRPDDDTLHWVLREIEPPELTRALEAENRIGASERQRVWYVACTRARELLVIPEVVATAEDTWARVVDNALVGIPDLSLTHFGRKPIVQRSAPENPQTPEVFRREELIVRGLTRELTWVRPSDKDQDRLQTVENIVVDQAEMPDIPVPVGAGRVRGLLLHKLIEEVLTGELVDRLDELTERAAVLLEQIGDDGTARPHADELARTVMRTLSIPEIEALRPKLVPEFALYSAEVSGSAITSLAGRVDAMVLDEERPSIVFDWKSDTVPDIDSIRVHAIQLRDYLLATGAPRGALVYMTTGAVHWVER